MPTRFPVSPATLAGGSATAAGIRTARCGSTGATAPAGSATMFTRAYTSMELRLNSGAISGTTPAIRWPSTCARWTVTLRSRLKNFAHADAASACSKLAASPACTFLRTYFLQAGFLDGAAGFTLARMAALYTFRKYSKARRKQAATHEAAGDANPASR